LNSIASSRRRSVHGQRYPNVRATNAPGDARQAQQLGGKTILLVTELPQVTISLFADPEGHVIGLAKGR
jgi:predicted enzyme related to lactoylglutathione lyase